MEKILSTKERIKILRGVIFDEKPISINAVAKRLKLSKGLVSKYFDVLLKEDIAKKSHSKYIISDSALTKGVKILLNISDIDTKIFRKYDFIKAAGLYGSCAKGENTTESDVDIWIKVSDVSDEKIASLASELSSKINKVKPLFLTDEKLSKIKNDDRLFYHSLSFGSIALYGEKDEI